MDQEIEEYSKLVPAHVDDVTTMSEDKVNATWEAIYKLMGVSSAGEDEKKAIRCGVYTYARKNGTSRAGGWNKTFTTANGKTYEAACVLAVTGKFELRRFFRGNERESYKYLKYSGVVESTPKLMMEGEQYGVAPECVFALADWLDDCPFLMPEEKQAHEKARVYNYERAKRARGGKSLEAIEDEQRAKALEVQGPLESGTPTEKVVHW